MLKEDALLYFPLVDDIEIDELYDQLLFEQKQFLSNRMPISKVFNPRIARLRKMDEAYVFFGGNNQSTLNPTIELRLAESDSIEVSYLNFQENLNLIKLELFKAKNVNQLLVAIDNLFKNQQYFAHKMGSFGTTLDYQPIVSKEPDAMEILSGIKFAKENGVITFDQLSQLPDDNILVEEANRLSLWLKLETNV